MEQVLRAYETPEHLTRATRGVTGSIYTECEAGNIPPRSAALLATATPAGWFTLTADGKLVLIKDGAVFDGPLAPEAVDSLKAEVEKKFPVVVFGAGAGHGITQLRSLTAAPILVYDPDPDLLARFVGLGMPLPGVTLTCALDDFREIFPHFVQSKIGATLFATTEYASGYAEQFAAFEELFKRLLDAEKVTNDTIEFRMPEWVEHTIDNLSAVPGSRPAMQLTGALKGVPCFIVGGGPSLNRNGALLQKAREKGLVLTIDVAGKACEYHGCEPHGMITVEAKDMAAHFDGLPWMDRVARLYSLACHPTAFRRGGGPLMPWCDSNHPFKTIAEDILNAEGLPLGGSCTTAAFLLAEAMGCNPIVMIGQDLVDSPPDEPNYCEGVLRDTLVHKHGDFSTVKRWGSEEMIPDQVIWRHARVWFEHRASWVRDNKPGVRMINASEGGSHVDGWEHIPLVDVLGELPDLDVSARFAAACEAIEPVDGKVVSRWRKWHIANLRKIVTTARKAQRMSARAAKMLRASEVDVESTQAFINDRNAAEMAFRGVASQNILFAGYVQGLIKRLNDSKQAAQELSHAEAADMLMVEAESFQQVAERADALRGRLARDA